jgi:hypothetical protein
VRQQTYVVCSIIYNASSYLCIYPFTKLLLVLLVESMRRVAVDVNLTYVLTVFKRLQFRFYVDAACDVIILRTYIVNVKFLLLTATDRKFPYQMV